jgi:DNA-binding transcriptional regulator YiaG
VPLVPLPSHEASEADQADEARRLRDEEHLSYAEISRRLGVGFATVKFWMSGNGRRRVAA